MANLDRLPEEVKRVVLDFTERPTTLLLWQVSKNWRAAAEPFVYKEISIQSATLGDLHSTIDELQKHRFAQKYLKHAR
jgi:hypothetical protein